MQRILSTQLVGMGIYIHIFYRFMIVEFKSDLTFDYHIMSERAHRQTSGKYNISGDTIILNSFTKNSEFDFQNTKWIILSRKQIVISNNLNEKKENWSILKRDSYFDSIPRQRSDLSIKVDSIKINCLSWIKDSINYDAELKIIIHDPLSPKEPVVVLDGLPIQYEFLLDFYTLADVDSLNFITGEKLINSGIHGGQAENGMIVINTKKKKPKR